MSGRSNNNNNNKHNNVWVKSVPSHEVAEKELFTIEAEIANVIEPFSSSYGLGTLKIYESKIEFQIKGDNLAFIQLSEEVLYNTYENRNSTSAKFYMKINKNQMHSYIVFMNEEDMMRVDQQLNKIIFKNDFYSSYDVIDLIGNGTYSQVSLVKHKISGQKFAVKTISKNRVNLNAQNKKELMNEINLLRRLNHENIMRGVEYFETDNAYKLVLEYYSGKTLECRLQQIKSIKLSDACFIMKQILQGLRYLHQKNIMHRDLKPENILLKDANTYEIVIADIGFAQDLYQDFVLPKCGSPGYIAPEVMNSRDGKDCGTKTDMFSCGLLFYRIVAGKPLFGGSTVDAILMSNKKFKIDLSISQITEYPLSVQKIIQGMLEISPVRRISAEQSLQSGFYNLDSEGEQYICNNQFTNQPAKSYKSSFNSEKCTSSQITNSPPMRSSSRQTCPNSARTSFKSSFNYFVKTEPSEIRIGRIQKEKIEDQLISFDNLADLKSPSRISKTSSIASFNSSNNSPILKVTSSLLQKTSPLKKILLKGQVAQTFRDSVDNMKHPSQFTQKRSFVSELR